jgi:hypothetical protein
VSGIEIFPLKEAGGENDTGHIAVLEVGVFVEKTAPLPPLRIAQDKCPNVPRKYFN